MRPDAFRWLPFIHALSELYETKRDKWWFTLFFLGEQREFRPFGSPYFRVSGGGQSDGVITAGLFGSRDFLPGSTSTLQQMGWRAATNKYEADFCLNREPGASLANSFWQGLGAVATIAYVTADDFLHIHLHEHDESAALAIFNPTTKGDYVYYLLDAPADDLRRSRDALAAAPIEPHLKPRLTAADRDAFILRNEAIIPQVREWTDEMILEAEAHGF